MEHQVETLADYVRRVRNEKRLSLADVHVQAKRAGLAIGKTHINRIENGFIEPSSVTPGKLRALAAGLGIPEDEIFDVARGKLKVTEADLADDEQIAALFYEYKELTEEDKQELRTTMEIVRQEIRRRRAAGELASQKNSKKVRVR